MDSFILHVEAAGAFPRFYTAASHEKMVELITPGGDITLPI